jgi:uncharacterized protein (DUF2345 family)
MKQPTEACVLAAQYVLIGPAGDPAAIASAFANLPAIEADALEASPTTAKIPTTSVKIWSLRNGGRLVEVTTHAGNTASKLVLRRGGTA